MYIMYMLCFCTLCSNATCEWPEFYVNKVMFCSILLLVDLINVVYLPAFILIYQVNVTLHFLNDIDDVELMRKSIIRS